MFRPGLLADRRIACVTAGDVTSNAWATGQDPTSNALRELGATCAPIATADEQGLEAWVAGNLPLHGLVLDATPSFGAGGPESLSTALERAWVATRAVATGALIPAQSGRMILIAPRPDAGPHADAARAGLENLARTLSVEWARFGVTSVAITPGAATTVEELATLVTFLFSEAGGYFTGCRFDLGVTAARPFISAS